MCLIEDDVLFDETTLGSDGVLCSRWGDIGSGYDWIDLRLDWVDLC